MPRLEDLNPVQRAAVEATDGPVLILAGAGSGKTRVITHRIAYLVSRRKATPDEIMAVTFTNKAAAEMKERAARLAATAEAPAWVSTFHAACARILRAEAPLLGFERNFSIIDEADSLALLRRLLEEARLPEAGHAEAVRARLEQAKNDGVSPEELAQGAVDPRQAQLAEIYRLYQQRLRAANAMDFADLLLMTCELFRAHPEVLARWQARARYLLIDEFQDTNRSQYLLVKALSAQSGNLCAVGDEDQSIYRWRGADIRIILDFERDFLAARVFALEQNYRSSKMILAAAYAVIRNNRERKPKRLWTANSAGEPVRCFTGVTERDEANFIAREIERLVEAGLARPSEIVVFYRVNAQSRVLEEALSARRIPYVVVGGLRFYDHREVKELLAYLRAALNPRDVMSLGRALAAPPRGIGAKTLALAGRVAARDGLSPLEALAKLEGAAHVPLGAAREAAAFSRWMVGLGARAPAAPVQGLIEEVISRSGFLEYLDRQADGAARRRNVAELFSSAAAFDAEHGPGGLESFLERAALAADGRPPEETGGRVALMTLHTSKGLEYRAVFMAGMEEDLFPHARSAEEPTELEEERRLCYVGMTRARELLYLTKTLSRELYGQRSESSPSRFLAEIGDDLMVRLGAVPARRLRERPAAQTYVDYADGQLPQPVGGGLAVGSRVVHHSFGLGVVRRLEGRGENAKAWVSFDGRGLKLLMLKFAALRPVAD